MRATTSSLTLLSIVIPLASQVQAASKPSAAIPFSPGFDIEAVVAQAVSLPSHSWEFGTASEALLELFDGPISVYGAHPFPVPKVAPAKSQSLTYAQSKIVIGTPPNGLSDGDGAAGDPASLGVSAVLLGKTNATFAAAATAEAEYLVSQVPRFWNGAISHRALYAELWADSMYMVPPFLAYYGVATNNASFLQTAVQQVSLYRDILIANTTAGAVSPPSTHSPNATGLWTHILGPVSTDPGIWSTGNAWAAGGATRVLATLVKAPSTLFTGKPSPAHPTEQWRAQGVASLVKVISDILDGATRAQLDSGLLHSYIDDPTWFGEISGSSLLAATAYRLTTLSNEGLLGKSTLSKATAAKYISFAEGIRTTLATGDHIVNGTATPAINPLNWFDHTPFTTGSPEGNNFVVLLYAAWRDCVLAGVKGCKRPSH
ncbi:hypothetical protein D9619_010640 [Psilocybe cf. subviscida]|uniref:Uncharacterized protein n=1 Tax=Psilocybe cf. subviscida TaxID=2480587 RepID=A0A8H5B8C0_9AGAR|nr:hypothetical protein D9619_010640 [Psilocybe cf. subviscida]